MHKCNICNIDFDTWLELKDHRLLHEEQIEDEWRGIFQKFN